jgi:CheY-like chemotaxis protein
MHIEHLADSPICPWPVSVLLVEDEELLRLSVSKILRRSGFSVVEAADGSAATSLFAANRTAFSVVFLDLTLPGLSGLQVAEELRRLRRDIQIVFTTAYSQEVALGEVDRQTSGYFIRKPYKIGDLVQVLRAAAGIHSTGCGSVGSQASVKKSESSDNRQHQSLLKSLSHDVHR